MADDTKGLEAGGAGAGRAEPAVSDHAGDTPSTTRPQPVTDWTASDTRGPLNEAPPVAEPIDGEAARDDLSSSATEVPLERPASAGGASAASPSAPSGSSALGMTDPVKPPRRSLLPIAAALVVGAAIGGGSAYLVYQSQQAGNDALDQKVAHLSERVDTLDKRPDPQPSITALKGSVATLDGKVAALQKAPASAPPVTSAMVPTPTASSSKSVVAGSSSTTSAPSASATGTSSPNPGSPAAPPVSTSATQTVPAFDPAPLQQKIAALQAMIDNLQKQTADAKALAVTVGAIQVSVDGLKTQTADVQKQASETQAGVEAIQGQQKSFEGRISAPALAVVADSLVQQINQGQSYGQQVDALATLGADPARIAILRENARKGVPSAKILAAQFKPLAEPILATEHKVAPNAGLIDRLKSGMSGLVSVRNTGDTTGDGLDARVSRIEADLTHDDVTGAYMTWAALPDDAKAKSDAWGALAKTAAEAIDAAHALQQGAIATLGGRKS